MTDPLPRRRRRLKFYEEYFAGGVAGVAELCTLYPLDVVKTRVQAAVGRRVLWRELASLVRVERLRMYRGLLFPLCMEGPKIASKFAVYGACSRALNLHGAEAAGVSLPYLRIALCGAAAGVAEGSLICAPETVKIRMQLPDDRGRIGVYRNSVACAQAIMRKEGVRALFRGQCATWLRNGVQNTCFFPTVAYLKDCYKRRYGKASYHRHEVAVSFLCGSAGGGLSVLCNTPADFVKTRIQHNAAVLHTTNDPRVAALPTRILPYFVHIVRTEGPCNLWRGLGPKVARFVPGGGIIIVTFEAVAGWLAAS